MAAVLKKTYDTRLNLYNTKLEKKNKTERQVKEAKICFKKFTGWSSWIRSMKLSEFDSSFTRLNGQPHWEICLKKVPGCGGLK